MLTTFSTYQLYTRDSARTMERIAADPVNKREAEYYRANIGNVTTLDEFMDDYRLYSYAMTAFGMADQIDSRGLIRKVLESDLSDPKSLANKLADERYRDLAKAFNFQPTEEAKEPSAQMVSQLDRTVDAYSTSSVSAANALKSQIDNYRTKLNEVSNVDEFLKSDVLYKTAMSAAGLDESLFLKSYIRSVLVGEVDLGTLEDWKKSPGTFGMKRALAELQGMFNFEADGSVGASGLQSELEVNDTINSLYENKGLLGTLASTNNDIEYWNLRADSITTADQLTQDPRMLQVALRSFGIDADIQSSTFVYQILTSDPADPDSKLNKMPEGTELQKTIKQQYAAFRNAFQFAADGSLASGATSMQTEAAEHSMLNDFVEKNSARTGSRNRMATIDYKVAISDVRTTAQFIRDPRVFEYALKAFGIDPQSVSKTDIVKVLRSDPGDPNSFAVKSKDPRFLELAKAFNFGTDGKIMTRRVAQESSEVKDTIDRYADSFGFDGKKSELDKLLIANETSDYRFAINDVASVEDFVSNKTLVSYVTRAFDIEDLKLTKEELTAILTSDIDDPESAVNVRDDERLRELRFAFAFNTNGGLREPETAVQSKRNLLKIEDNYLRQMLEEEAGSQNDGVRLALYFKRMAGDIKNTYEILADPRLIKVVQTAIGLPAESGQADLEIQKRTIEKRLDVKTLKDPEHLSRFINRFLAMYDTENGGGGAANPALALFNSGGGGGGGGLLGML
ncbi:DUF1217 domain-containing protein [Fulvimarina sp. MAC8]|uniref:DUF1217 domain-containing protein n=1 Tax=Fulvimarina sp. MAC8 TaxID=3162874 RepID=UPI0032F01401